MTLSVSLHAYSDEKRRELMPVARKYPLDALMEACRYYFEKTGRRISFEYTLIAGKNDSPEDARGIVSLLREKMGYPSHVNLILLNEVKETGLRRPAGDMAAKFAEMLVSMGQNATVRRSLGGDIEGACGQLRRTREADRSGKENFTKG